MLQHGEQFQNALVVSPPAGRAGWAREKSGFLVIADGRSPESGLSGYFADGHRSNVARFVLDLNLTSSGMILHMRNPKLVIAVIAASLCLAENQAPFACNLKAFQPEQRQRWRLLLDKVYAAEREYRELAGGYAFRLDTKGATLTLPEIAAWIDLERRCCPFFDFELTVHGADGTVWLSLKGRPGVKQFIEMDMPRLRGR
jgi:hypothetical protein